MFELTAADFLAMRKRHTEPMPEGHIAAGVEFQGPQGEICTFYTAQLAPEVSAQPDVAEMGEVLSVQLREEKSEEGECSWFARLQGSDPEYYLDAAIPAEEVHAVLEKFDLLPLPIAVEVNPKPAEPEA